MQRHLGAESSPAAVHTQGKAAELLGGEILPAKHVKPVQPRALPISPLLQPPAPSLHILKPAVPEPGWRPGATSCPLGPKHFSEAGFLQVRAALPSATQWLPSHTGSVVDGGAASLSSCPADAQRACTVLTLAGVFQPGDLGSPWAVGGWPPLGACSVTSGSWMS